jgi:hypothetical protein
MRFARFALGGGGIALLLACGGTGGGPWLPSGGQAPGFASQPTSVTIEACGGATFAVQATGSPPFGYQWFANGIAVPGATESSHGVARAGLAESGVRYSVVVANAAGSARSEEATLTVVDSAGPTVFAEGRVFGMASDGATVYWTDGLGVNAASIDCSGPIRSLYQRATFMENTYAMVQYGSRVVWTDQAGGSIKSVPKDGGTAATLASQLGAGGPLAVALAGDQLYWPNLVAGIQSVPVDGGSVTTYPVGIPGVFSDGIAADDLYVYWTDLRYGTVTRMSLDGGPVVVLASDQGSLGGIATDGQSVYWASTEDAESDQPTGNVVKVGRDGGLPVVLASQPGRALQLGVDEAFVYFTGAPASPGSGAAGSLSRVPLDGSEPPEVLASGLDAPSRVIVDSLYVYWRDGRGLMRLPK